MQQQDLAASFVTAITGFDGNTASVREIEAIRHLVYARKVVALKHQRLDRDTYQRFAARFGRLEPFKIKNYSDPDYPNILVINNRKRDGGIGARKVGNMWHSDSSYLPEPLPLSFLHAQRVPDGVGDTLFVDTEEALARLAEPLREQLQGGAAVHDIRWTYKVKPEDVGELIQEIFTRLDASAPASRHPVILLHPRTRRRSLYINPGYTVRLSGYTEERSRALLAAIFAAVLVPQRIFAHRWEVGDLLIWDNRSVWHAATDVPADAERIMFRIGVTDGRFFGRDTIGMPERLAE